MIHANTQSSLFGRWSRVERCVCSLPHFVSSLLVPFLSLSTFCSRSPHVTLYSDLCLASFPSLVSPKSPAADVGTDRQMRRALPCRLSSHRPVVHYVRFLPWVLRQLNCTCVRGSMCRCRPNAPEAQLPPCLNEDVSFPFAFAHSHASRQTTS